MLAMQFLKSKPLRTVNISLIFICVLSVRLRKGKEAYTRSQAGSVQKI